MDDEPRSEPVAGRAGVNAPAGWHDGWLGAVTAVVLCEAVGVTSALTTDTGNSDWYRALRKPPFNPPAWVFGPVWTLLYAAMGVAVHQLWRRRNARGGRRALLAFAIQLALNFTWTPIFFGLHATRAALAVIVTLWFAIAATVGLSWRVSRPAAWLLVPYWLWATFATVLNAAIVVLNGSNGSPPAAP
jgi:tryptophan-rich sensory protein